MNLLVYLWPHRILLAAYRAVTTARFRAALAAEARTFAASGSRLAAAIVNNIVLSMLVMAAVERYNPVDVVYWAAQTISTVGYGDIPPETTVGRVVGIWFMVSMVPLVLLAGAHFVSLAIPNFHLFDHAEQEQVKADARAARLWASRAYVKAAHTASYLALIAQIARRQSRVDQATSTVGGGQ